jgi:hypothetical protein
MMPPGDGKPSLEPSPADRAPFRLGLKTMPDAKSGFADQWMFKLAHRFAGALICRAWLYRIAAS